MGEEKEKELVSMEMTILRMMLASMKQGLVGVEEYWQLTLMFDSSAHLTFPAVTEIRHIYLRCI